MSIPIGQLLVSVFAASRASNIDLSKRWIKASFRLGGLLPRSMMMVTIQRLGEVDLVCRALENELKSQPAKEGEMDFRDNYLAVFSEWWINAAYSVCYIIQNRKLRTDAKFLQVADELRMIRVQNEKYEIPSDRNLIEPAVMIVAGTGEQDKTFIYDKADPQRAHIGRRGMSDRHSMMWEVIDAKSLTSSWLERTALSDRFLDLSIADAADDG